jgi:glycosyltransferase involved in cell wall biosynthesis
MKYFLKLIVILLSTTLLASASKKIVVDLAKQEAFAYEDNKLVLKGWISSGKAEYKTPRGRYRVLAKEKFHISNEWPKPDGGAEMPYMLRLTWSGIALHLGYVPNHPASHGCIRVKNNFAQMLYKWADVGTRVIVKGKQPKYVSRKHRSPFYMTRYFYKKYNTTHKKEYRYLAKESRSLRKLSKAHLLAMAKKKAKRLHLAKKKNLHKKKLLAKRKLIAKRKYVSKKSKLVKYYSKFSYKRLNKILRQNYRKKASILASSRLSKQNKIKQLKRIKWIVNIVKSAKYSKKHHKSRYKRVALR